MHPDAIEAYAIGYYYGRTIGSDEDGRIELETRFSSFTTYEQMKSGFKHGYERGVSDYVDFDEIHEGTLTDKINREFG